MKKLLLLPVLLCTLLCGCAQLYSEPEQTVIISALGIDGSGQELDLTIETVDTALPDGNWEYSPKTLEITAESCEKAFELLQRTLGNKLSCQHCVLVIKGGGVNEELLLEALTFLREKENLSQNTKIVGANNAKAFLGTKSHTGQAVGFDAVKILNMSKNKKALLGCNLYSVLKTLKKGKSPALPFFKTTNSGYFLEGAENE